MIRYIIFLTEKMKWNNTLSENKGECYSEYKPISFKSNKE